jgi:hypothetical protein
MPSQYLNDHDANQGAQSSGEFLGMTGNSGWYLLGSGGVTILMVILLWGVLGVSLLLCLLVGIVLCGLSVTYVFTLKNNKPEHYDTDFFESALVEAGLLQFAFGPRARCPANPFTASSSAADAVVLVARAAERRRTPQPAANQARAGVVKPTSAVEASRAVTTPSAAEEEQPVVAQRDYERLQEQLASTEEMLEDALAEGGEA